MQIEIFNAFWLGGVLVKVYAPRCSMHSISFSHCKLQKKTGGITNSGPSWTPSQPRGGTTYKALSKPEGLVSIAAPQNDVGCRCRPSIRGKSPKKYQSCRVELELT